MIVRWSQATALLVLGWWAGGGQYALGSSIAMNPGVYQITTATLLPNLEENLRYTTTHSKKCLGEQAAAIFFPVLRQRSFVGCSLVDAPADDHYRHYALICRNAQAATGTARFDLNATTFYAELKVKMGGKNMQFSQTSHGLRLGSCASLND